MCTIFKLIHMLWAGRACYTLSVPPIWRSATTQIRLPNTFHPPKCQMQSRQPERLRLPNYMQLRWRGRGMRLVKQKCGTMKTGSKSWGRNCHNARRIKATKNLPSTPKKPTAKVQQQCYNMGHTTTLSQKHSTKFRFHFGCCCHRFLPFTLPSTSGGPTCSAWLFSLLSSSGYGSGSLVMKG